MTPTPASPGMIGAIPVRNIWLLMLYASRLYQQLPSRRRYGVEENPDDIPNLVAEILTGAVERRIRRNLTLEFHRSRADLTRVRGRIDALRTECRSLLRQGKIACSFEELTTDTPRNRLVKAALNKLRGSVSEEPLRRRCRSLAAALDRAGVGDETSAGIRSRSLQGAVAAGRANAEDRLMLAAADLAFRLSLPTEDPGLTHLPAPGRDEVWARTSVRVCGGRLLQHGARTPRMVGQARQMDRLADRGADQDPENRRDHAPDADRHRLGWPPSR